MSDKFQKWSSLAFQRYWSYVFSFYSIELLWTFLVVIASHSIGISCNQSQECHKTIYTKRIGLKRLSELTNDEGYLFLRRNRLVNPVPETTLCLSSSPWADIFTAILFFFRSHVILLNYKLAPVKRNLWDLLDITTADKVNKLSGNNVHPGQKLCHLCWKQADAKGEESDSEMELCT